MSALDELREKRAILFDFGGTLVRYYERHEYPAILKQAIVDVRACVISRSISVPSAGMVWARVKAEDFEARNHRVRPLEQRLSRIFGLRGTEDCIPEMCRAFMKPIFALGECYEDALPNLRELMRRGVRTAIISNTPWGSPADLWHGEITRLGLHGLVDEVVFCRDAGWRKPARPVFLLALYRLGLRPKECLFVGDHPRWDLAGARAVGMDAALIDRQGTVDLPRVRIIRELSELV